MNRHLSFLPTLFLIIKFFCKDIFFEKNKQKIPMFILCFALVSTSYAQLDLPVDFEEAVTLVDFGGAASTQVADPTDANNMVAQSIKTDGAATYAGTTLNGDDGFDTAIPFSVSSKTISVRVYSPDANTVVRLKVEDASNAGITVETEATTTGVNTWETLEFNFANQAAGTAELNMANTYNKASIFFDFGNAGTGKTYLWDDVMFVTTTTTGPTTAAPTPTCNTADVISIFSDAYTNIGISEINPNWGQSGAATVEMIAGGEVLKYANFNYQGTQLAADNDLSQMDHLHIDMWTADATEVTVSPINNGGNPIEKLISLTPITPGTWNSYDIPLSEFTSSGMSIDKIYQMKFAGGSGSTLYLDNIYFSKGCVALPTPTSAVTFAVDMNAHSGSFTTVYVSGAFNNWSGDANPLTDADGDGVWTGTMEMEHGEQEYKFTLDNWSGEETLESGSDCTKTTGENINRVITVSGSTDVCFTWETCDACTCAYLVWSDEFDGSELDLGKWTPQIGTGSGGWGNQELQYYRAENATVADGKLTITAKDEVFGGANYTSSRLRTINQGDWKYGRFEASIKLPIGQGLWPAFWMMPTDDAYGTWPRSGEIDIMELLGHKPEEIFGTIHFGSSFETRRSIGNTHQLPSGNFNEDFHVFAIEWEENLIRWYVDDILYATRTADEVSPDNWPFDQNFHFILNVAVGGNFPGSPDGTTTFPQAMEVDYVRVYKGVFPTLSGSTSVLAQTAGEVYTIENATAGVTYTWTVPTGATITDGQGTSAITVTWGDATSGGSITATDDCSQRTLLLDVAVVTPEQVLEDFDTEAIISYKSSSGTLTDNTNNPGTNDINGSALVGQYCRNAGAQYDDITYSIAPFEDASLFVNNTKKFYIDLYTAAPVGTEIILQLENDSQAEPTNYPTGRHSRYNVKTTVQNAWERLVFDFVDQPGSVANNTVDNIVILFNPNSTTDDCYYFDNFEIYCAGELCVAAENCPESIVIDETNISDSTYRATTISSAGTVESGSEVTFAAASSVTLKEGFHAKAGATFTAMIEDCNVVNFQDETSEEVARLVTPLNVEQAGGKLDIKVFPNPMENQLIVQLKAFEEGQLRLFDGTGKTHISRIVTGVTTLNVNDLPAGIYFLQVWDKTSGEVFTRKVIRQE